MLKRTLLKENFIKIAEAHKKSSIKMAEAVAEADKENSIKIAKETLYSKGSDC